MAFLIYKEQNNGCWAQVRALKLGNTIASHVQKQIKRSGFAEPLKWEASEQQLLAAEDGQFGDGRHRLVIDLKPNTERNLSLYQIQHIWGWTIEGWTPIALRLRPLFTDHRVQDAAESKSQFKLPSDKELADIGGPVHEFLYFWHKTPLSSWNWGLVGHVNGALLWPDVFDYFVNCIRNYGQGSATAGA